MPIHDWTRVRPNRFHDFHQGWTVAISNALNAGRLPSGYFSMIEKKDGWPEPDAIALALAPPTDPEPAEAAESARYARKANRVTVRHPDDWVVAVVEIVSPGNKDSRHAIRAFVRKAVALLQARVNLLIVDLFPPGRRDPQGIHKVVWDHLRDEPFELPPDKPLTLAAYAVGAETVAYVEPVAVGDSLPDMPVFLTGDRYVPCPLEETYRTAWEQFPAPLRGPLEPPSAG